MLGKEYDILGDPCVFCEGEGKMTKAVQRIYGGKPLQFPAWKTFRRGSRKFTLSSFREFLFLLFVFVLLFGGGMLVSGVAIYFLIIDPREMSAYFVLLFGIVWLLTLSYVMIKSWRER